MIVKIQDDKLQDKHLIEAARFAWNSDGSTPNNILDCFAALDDHSPTKLRVHHGDRVFFMNDSGQTIDSKRIELKPECSHDDLQN